MSTLSRDLASIEGELGLRVALCALYLRGLPRPLEPNRRGWPMALNAIRKASGNLADSAEALRCSGLEVESLLIQDAYLLEHALGVIERRKALSVADTLYPIRWVERLGASAPPVIWWNGVPFREAEPRTIVGSRELPKKLARLVSQFASKWTLDGHLIVSGGAMGTDRLAAKSALRSMLSEGGSGVSPVVELLPCGIHAPWPKIGGAVVAVVEPHMEFSVSAAMERNALLYAWSSISLVAHARLRQGGSWSGATDALRRRLSRIAVFEHPENEAAPALMALGAVGIKQLADLDRIEHSGGSQLEMTYQDQPPNPESQIVAECRAQFASDVFSAAS